jgi:hypothetical protein
MIKGKAVPLHAMEALGGRGGIAPTHSDDTYIYFSLDMPVVILSIDWWLFCMLHVAYRPYEVAEIYFTLWPQCIYS